MNGLFQTDFGRANASLAQKGLIYHESCFRRRTEYDRRVGFQDTVLSDPET